MKLQSLVKILAVTAALPFALVSCKNENNNNSGGEAFDRKVLLENFADNIVIPHWAKMKAATDSLALATDAFITSPQSASLQTAQNTWVSAYRQWQHCNAFNFGPAEKSILGTAGENLGTWPVNVPVVETRVANADYNFADFRRDSRGLLTVEYLLFSPAALDSFTTSVNAPSRGQYLQKVVQDIKAWVDEINTGWTTYRATFVNNTGKAAGSPTSMLYNEFIKNYEAMKNFKIALPAGKRAGQTQAEPQLVEAYYSGKSIVFLKENYKSVENIWRGIGADGIDRTGFDDYLDKVTGGPALKAETITQLATLNAINAGFGNNEVLSALIINEPARVDNLHTEYQKALRYFKSDLSSLLGIAITYSSGDGD